MEVSRVPDCIFCKIASGEIPATIVYQDELCVAFEDLNPVAPAHVLVIPRQHLANLADANDSDRELLGHLCLVCDKVAEIKGLCTDGYRMVTNKGEKAGQTVFHLHMHVIGGRDLTWPPG